MSFNSWFSQLVQQVLSFRSQVNQCQLEVSELMHLIPKSWMRFYLLVLITLLPFLEVWFSLILTLHLCLSFEICCHLVMLLIFFIIQSLFPLDLKQLWAELDIFDSFLLQRIFPSVKLKMVKLVLQHSLNDFLEEFLN